MIELPERHPQTLPPRPFQAADAGWSDALALNVLDELDYPILLVDAALRLVVHNRAAVLRLRGAAPLRIVDGAVQVLADGDAAALRGAVEAAAQRGLRRLLMAGGMAVAVVPIGDGDERRALLILARPSFCPELSVHGYARDLGLSPSEKHVLRALCAGESPQDIARQRGVKLSTVRSQIASLRVKTGANDIRALVRQVATLPPIVSALMLAGGGPH